MNITILHGQMHKGSTYHITELLKTALVESHEDAKVEEFFLPKDGPSFCIGCFQCIQKGASHCPEEKKVQPIIRGIMEGDIILVDSPTYVMEMSGQLKTMFDHMAYMWMSHRPEGGMFSKTVISISTSAGAGHKNVVKSMNRQFFYLGVSQRYRLAYGVGAMKWDDVKPALKDKIAKDIAKTAEKINKDYARKHYSPKVKGFFLVMRMMQRGNNWMPKDRQHWEDMGWLDKKRPWNSV